jgi:CTP synthase (UTP-ammonia lyase)
VLGIPDADSSENQTASKNFVVTAISCALPRGPNDPPALNSRHRVNVLPGSRLHALCGIDWLDEEHFCNYGISEEYVERFEAAGLRISARGESGDVRAVELAEHPFFISTLFHPHRRSHHPFIAAFVEAAATSAKIKASLA